MSLMRRQWSIPPDSHEWIAQERVVLFDGECLWCRGWVRWLIRHDRDGAFKFAALQSDGAHRLRGLLGWPSEGSDTLLLLEGTQVSSESTAALLVARQLVGFRLLASLGLAVPRPLRDALYRWVSRHRYHWRGKGECCAVPAPEARDRFL